MDQPRIRGRWKVDTRSAEIVEAPRDTSWRDRAQKEIEEARKRPKPTETVTIREGQIVAAKDQPRGRA